MELCNVCDKYIQKTDMQSHILGKKHLKLVDILDKNKRSIIVNIPGTVSKSEMYTFFSQHGTIKSHRMTLSCSGIVFEFNDTRVAEFLTSNPIYMKGKKLRIKKKLSYHEVKKYRECDKAPEEDADGALKKIKEKANVEYSGIISYDRIQHVLDQDNTFDSQLLAFLNAVRVSNEELDIKYNQVCCQLDVVFNSIFPNCKAYKFGSTQMGIGFKECDLDIFMDIGEPVCDTNNSSQGWTSSKIFGKMKTVVYRLPQFFSEVVWIRSARVPIINFRFVPTNILCDVSFKNSLAVHKTELIKYCLSLDERVTPLMILIKYWGRHIKLKRTGSLRSYALILLIIFFFQQASVNILPSILELQKACELKLVDGWQVNFNATFANQSKTNTSTIPELLHGFFSFYSTFDFQSQVICTLDGVAHPRTVFTERQDLPVCVSRYKEYMAINPDAPGLILNNCGICIQDPIELNHNMTLHTTLESVQNFIAFCAVGAEVCASTAKQNSKHLLTNLFLTMPTNKLVEDQIAVKFILGQYTLDPKVCCSVAYQCVKSALEEILKLQVEILIHTENIEKRVLRCKGTWSEEEYDADNVTESPVQNLGPNINENSSGKCLENKTELEFVCGFRMRAIPAEFDVVFINQKHCHQVFTHFVNFVNVKLSPIVYRTLSNAVASQQ